MCPGRDALFLILFSLFSNKQDSVCVCVEQTEQTNDEYVETLRDISGV